MESHPHDTSTIWLPKQILNKDNTNRDANMNRGYYVSPPLDNNYRQIDTMRTAVKRRISFPQG